MKVGLVLVFVNMNSELMVTLLLADQEITTMICVKECLKFSRRLYLEFHDIESILIEIDVYKTQMLVCSMYRPLSSDSDYYEKKKKSDSIESSKRSRIRSKMMELDRSEVT